MDCFDMIGPVMIGPSSSHTAGAARIGYMARMILGEDPVRAQIGFHGSFAKTYRGHGTDRAVTGGLLGMQTDDVRIRDALTLAQEQGLEITFAPVNIRGAHPNTVRITVTGRSGKELTVEAASIGGGMIRVTRLNGFSVSFSGDSDTLIILHHDEPGRIAAVTMLLSIHSVNVGTMQVYREGTGEKAIMVLELDNLLPEVMLNELRILPGILNVTMLKGL